MSSSISTGGRGRTKAVNKESDSDSDESDLTLRTFQNVADGKFRSRVNPYQNNVEFPSPPLYAVNEVVYLVIPGQMRPAGPYTVSASMGNKRYKIKRLDNGKEHPTTVTEDRLVVPA